MPADARAAAAGPEPEPELEPALPRFRAVDLFGGAMSSQICSRFADVSTFRQVPDSQEVFVDTASPGSLTLELLERQGATARQRVCRSSEFRHGCGARVRSADKTAGCTDGTDAEAMLLLWRDAAEQNDVDPADAASLLLLGSGPLLPRPEGLGAHVAAVYQAHGWMRAESAVTPGGAQVEAGVAVAMVCVHHCQCATLCVCNCVWEGDGGEAVTVCVCERECVCECV